MGIIGALDSGLRNDHNVLITKESLMVMSIILASFRNWCIIISYPCLFISRVDCIFAGVISTYIPSEALDLFIKENDWTGGIMILAIGLNIAGLTKIRVANLLPAILLVGILIAIIFLFQ